MAALLTSLGISIHAPREGGDMFLRRGSRHFLISIHAPREGGDDPEDVRALNCEISIHAPREGGDVIQPEPIYGANYFNPRPPRGGRRCILWPLCLPVWVFQSTPPARGATSSFYLHFSEIKNFNPRPPRGGRHSLPKKHLLQILFQSTPPARGATQ